jgi:cell division protein FtsB
LAPVGNFVGSAYQNSSQKRIVTTDNWGVLGTSTFSVSELVNSVGAVGALSAALGSLPSTTLFPDEFIRCGIGTGTYGGQFAGSLGCAAKVGSRLYLNGGVSATQTATVSSGAMGRLGFSIGFGGAPPRSHQENLSQVPGLRPGPTLFELGSGDSSAPPPGIDNSMPFAKTHSPVIIDSSRLIATKAEQSDLDRLRQRLQELEREIVELRSGSRSGSTDEKVLQLSDLLKEKERRETELSQMLLEMRKQLNRQQRTIDSLIKRFSVKASN